MSAGAGSLAAKAVSDAGSAAPPSFDGHGWLVALNLGAMTAATLIAVVAFGAILNEWRRSRRIEAWHSPNGLFVRISILLTAYVLVSAGTEAAHLWVWDPAAPNRTGSVLFAKRLIDPIITCVGVAGIVFLSAGKPGLRRQLRRDPVERDIWQPKAMLWRMGCLGVSSMIAAALIVSLR